CEADTAAIYRPSAQGYGRVASYGYSPEVTELMKDNVVESGRGTTVRRTILERKIAHIPDVLADPEFTNIEFQKVIEFQKIAGIRTTLAVPLLREDALIGVIALARRTVRPFTDRQIELVTTFADQAVIAIENARLFDEVQTRTKELTESLEQQTATSEVLGVISSSPGELEPVFKKMLENAVRVCDANFGTMLLREKGAFRHVALHNMPPALPISFAATRSSIQSL